MRCEIGGLERGVVQRDRLNQALVRMQRGAVALSLRSRSLSILIVAGADEERHRLVRTDCGVSRVSGKLRRRRRRRGCRIGGGVGYPGGKRSVVFVGALESQRYILCGT